MPSGSGDAAIRLVREAAEGGGGKDSLGGDEHAQRGLPAPSLMPTTACCDGLYSAPRGRDDWARPRLGERRADGGCEMSSQVAGRASALS